MNHLKIVIFDWILRENLIVTELFRIIPKIIEIYRNISI